MTFLPFHYASLLCFDLCSSFFRSLFSVPIVAILLTLYKPQHTECYHTTKRLSNINNPLTCHSPRFHRYPRINKESLLPVATNIGLTGENAEAWYPPGHGDIYASFYNSGLLDKLIAEGKEYIFVSNIDNLGATVDLHILNHLMSQPSGKRCEFVMEVTDKTRADVKVRLCCHSLVILNLCDSYSSMELRGSLKIFAIQF